ncbi:MAG TPA: bifunctional UDP-N-acetylglucosamine diphosphorylase/glucosamine-1-phosphate N-acetyltransferase GlmU [Bryobacteraceae bacterium]
MKTSIAILAAGLGTRMKSNLAKVLHRAGGFTLVEHAVRAALSVAEPANIVAVVGHQADAVKKVLEPYGVGSALQTEQRGTGHALAMAEPQLRDAGGRLIVLYGDVPLLSGDTIRRLVNVYDQSRKGGVVITCELDDPTGYGRIVRAADGTVSAIVEHKAATDAQREIREINSGIYCFDADLVWKHLAEIGTANPAGEYYLTDIVEILRTHGHSVVPMLINDFSEILGINNRVELAQVDEILRKRKTTELMLGGVTIDRPETVTIDLDVQIAQDVIVESGVRILGKSIIGEGSVIGAGSVLTNAVIGAGVLIAPYTVIADSEVGDEAHVGPFARLRNQNQVGANVHIGNFVELKKTRMGKGAKANHLAYLGDSVIGSKTNIGAGTITCNYDGVNKHQTTIGEHAFIGSNSTLIAPIEIGDRAYVAAGSVLTKPVPPDSLALGRAHQVIKHDWKPKTSPKK